MPDQRNRREDFRIDDVLRMHVESLTSKEFEARKKRLGMRLHINPTLSDLLDRDAEKAAALQDAEFPGDLLRAIVYLDNKLNYLINMNMLKDSEYSYLEDREVNISATGMSFLTDQLYEVGQPVQITVSVPIYPPQVVELLAEVVWVKPRTGSQVQIGVGFRFRGAEEEEAIAKYIFGRHRELLRLEERLA